MLFLLLLFALPMILLLLTLGIKCIELIYLTLPTVRLKINKCIVG